MIMKKVRGKRGRRITRAQGERKIRRRERRRNLKRKRSKGLSVPQNPLLSQVLKILIND